MNVNSSDSTLSPLLASVTLGASLLISPLASAQNNLPPPAFNRNPASIEGELDYIDATRQPRQPLPGIDSFMQPWYDTKSLLADEFGFRFGIAYTPLYQVATSSLDRNREASGAIFEILGTWNPIDPGGDLSGTFGFRAEHRDRLWNDVNPQSLFLDIGAGTPTGIGFSEFDFSLAELWYEQSILKDRFKVRLGKMLPFGYYDFFLFKNPKTAFTNANFALNPSIAWPQFGLGALVDIRPTRNTYIAAGIHDANGTPTRSGFDTFFDDQEYFVIADVGWDPGYLQDDGSINPKAPDYHATFWHTDARTTAGRPEGWGFGVTAQKPIGDLTPFFRYGYSDGGPALVKHLVMGGIAWTNAFNYAQDTVGFAASWGRPSAATLDDQFTTELYYKMQWTRRLALTPAAQFIVNPSANPTLNTLAVFSFRARLDF